MRFYLGTHLVQWLWREEFACVPLFVSHRQLHKRKSLLPAVAPWCLDSGGFTELKLHGEWTVTPQEYVSSVRRYRDEIGGMEWAAPQDWMVEPFMLERTGLSVIEHQRRTVNNYLRLRDLAPELPFIPVLQGWTLDDYRICVDLYAAMGVDLTREPVVGVGSVCRRQATSEIEEIMTSLASLGIRLHGFGVKTRGLSRYAGSLTSADSLAWSFNARHRPPLPECVGGPHKQCQNCPRFALRWRHRLLASLPLLSASSCEYLPMRHAYASRGTTELSSWDETSPYTPP